VAKGIAEPAKSVSAGTAALIAFNMSCIVSPCSLRLIEPFIAAP